MSPLKDNFFLFFTKLGSLGGGNGSRWRHQADIHSLEIFISRFLVLRFIKSSIRKNLRSDLTWRVTQCRKRHSWRFLFKHMLRLKIKLLVIFLVAVKIKSDSWVTSWETESSALNKRCELCAHMMQPTCYFYRGGCHPAPCSLTPGMNPSIEGTEMKLRCPSLMTAFTFEDPHPMLPKSLLPSFFQYGNVI